MTNENNISKYPFVFLILYTLIYMFLATYRTFMPVYLGSIGLNKTSIGILLALGPFVAIFGQPIWGLAGDRSRTKNFVLKTILLGSSLLIITYTLSTDFYYLFGVIIGFSFFQTSVFPISDSITLEYLQKTRWKFGPIRMAGSIGFGLIAILVGYVLGEDISRIFIIAFIFLIGATVTSFFLPIIKGHQSEGRKISLLKLFKYHQLILFLILFLIVQITMGFYYSFFPIYYKEIGASSTFLGINTFVSAVTEVIFLLFASKIIKKLGVNTVLLMSAAITASRWLLLYFVSDIYAVILINSLHGMGFIVFTYSIATYINTKVSPKLKSSGQSLNAVIGQSLSVIVGSVLGGFLSDIIQIRQIFLYMSIIVFISVIVFGYIFKKNRNNSEHVTHLEF